VPIANAAMLALDALTISQVVVHRLDRTRGTIRAHILPSLGHIDLSKLTHGKVKAWRDVIAEAPPRVRTRKGQEQAYRAIRANAGDRFAGPYSVREALVQFVGSMSLALM
jgi:hypothetical protein